MMGMCFSWIISFSDSWIIGICFSVITDSWIIGWICSWRIFLWCSWITSLCLSSTMFLWCSWTISFWFWVTIAASCYWVTTYCSEWVNNYFPTFRDLNSGFSSCLITVVYSCVILGYSVTRVYTFLAVVNYSVPDTNCWPPPHSFTNVSCS